MSVSRPARAWACALLLLTSLMSMSARPETPVDPDTLGEVRAFLELYSSTAKAQSADFYDLYSDRAVVHVHSDGQVADSRYSGRTYKQWSRELLREHRLAIEESRFFEATVELRRSRLLIHAKRYDGGRCFWDRDYQVGLEREKGTLRIVDERLTTHPSARCAEQLAVAPPYASSPALMATASSSASPIWKPLSHAALEQSAIRLAQEAVASKRQAPAVDPATLRAAAGEQASPDALWLTPP